MSPLVLLLLATAAAAEPWRVALGRDLGDDDASVEEAHDVLAADLDEPEARRELVALCLREDPRPGWLDTYRRLAADPAVSRTDAAALDLRAAEALTWVPTAQVRAARLLRAALSRHPTRAVTFHLARAWMVTGHPAAALPLFERAPDTPANALGAHLARAALSNEGPLATRAAEVAGGGYPELAAWMVGRADPRRSDVDAWRARAEGWMARGRYAEAAADYASALKRHPDDDDLRRGLVDALLARGDLAAADRAAGESDAMRAVDAVRALSTAVEDAWALAPEVPAVRVAEARALVAAGRGGDALVLLRPLVAGPAGRDVLDAFADAALAAGTPEEAVDVWRAALVRASGPGARAKLADGLAALHARVAEAAKAGGDLVAAEQHWRVATAMRPAGGWSWAGLGGVLWQAGRLAEARDAYLEALARDPRVGDPDLAEDWRAAAIELCLRLHDLDAAEALLGPTDERMEALRRRVAAWRRVEGVSGEALAALSAGRPDDVELARIVAEKLLDEGAAALSAAVWARVSALLPDDPAGPLGEAAALAAAGNPDAAAARLDEARKRGAAADALTRAEAAIARSQGDQLRDRDPRGALDRYAAALDLAPDAWTWVALGGLYLEHGQPSAALACYDAGAAAAPTLAGPREGRIRALAALARWDEARAAAGGDPALQAVIAQAEERADVAHVDALAAHGDLDGARRLLAGALALRPGSAVTHAAAARLALTTGDAAAAFAEASRAVSLAPTDPAALAVLVDAAEAAGAWAEADALLREAPESVRSELRFRATLAGAQQLAARGAVADARARLAGALPAAAGDPDREARLGGAWFALGQTREADAAWARALAIAPAHPAATLGRAAILESEGRLLEARAVLEARWADAPDLPLADALVRLAVRTGDLPLAERASRSRDLPPRADPLPRVAVARDAPPEPTAATSDPVPTEPGVAALAEGRVLGAGTRSGIALPRRPALTVQAGALAGSLVRSGVTGEGALATQLGAAGVEWPIHGLVRGQASAVLLSLDDGTTALPAAALAAGARTVEGTRLGASAWLGTTPLGGTVAPAVTGLAEVTFRATPHLTLALDAGRVPMTDSRTSWVGSTADGVDWGRVTFDRMSAAASYDLAPYDAGGVAHLGVLNGAALDPVGRRELTVWGGRRFGDPDHWLRLGAAAGALGDDRQVDRYVPGEAGVYTPPSVETGEARVDGRWALGVGALCGGARAGVEDVHGEATERLTPGVHPAYGARVGATLTLGGRWSGGVVLRYDTAGLDWNQRSGAVWLGWEGDSPTIPAALGSGLTTLGECR